MKTRIALLAAITFFAGSQVADAADCKYQTNEHDLFTKVLTQHTKWNALTSSWMATFRKYGASISVIAIDGDARLLLKMQYYDDTETAPSEFEMEDVFFVPEGAPLLIAMEDKSVVKLPAISEVRQNAYSIAPEDQDGDVKRWAIRATVIIEYALSESAIEALASQPATKFRITMADDESAEVDIHKKSFSDFKTAAECIS